MKLNPILTREMTVFQRGWKLPVLILLYNGLMILLLAGLYTLMNKNGSNGGGIDIGYMNGLYYFVTFGQLVLLLLMVPAVTAGAISGERQRGTLDILLVSAKSTWEIILGKLEAGLFAVGLLMVSSLPFYAIVGVYGGVGFLEVIGNLVVFSVLAISYGAIGLAFSSWFKKNQAAMIFTYVVIFINSVLTLIITFIGLGLYNAFWNVQPSVWLSFLLYVNPFVVMLTHLDVQMVGRTSLLAVYEHYNPLVSLMVMIGVHLILSLGCLALAQLRLKER